MTKRAEYYEGQVMGNYNCVFLHEVSSLNDKNNRRGIFRCACGKEFETRIRRVKDGGIRSCGCAASKAQRIKYKAHQKIGACVFLYDIADHISPIGEHRRVARFLCKCGEEFDSYISNVKKGTTRSCGCASLKRIQPNEHITSHQLDLLYYKWESIKQRCYNKNCPDYKDYGAIGIIMCDEWKNDSNAFVIYIIGLENAMARGRSLDRTNNDGDYKPGNVRWATSHQQRVNQRPNSRNTSGYVGVSLKKDSRKWLSYIKVKGIQIYLGVYKTKEEAVTARNNYIISNNLAEYKIQEVKK